MTHQSITYLPHFLILKMCILFQGLGCKYKNIFDGLAKIYKYILKHCIMINAEIQANKMLVLL